jgi:hypothetical protein
MATDSAALPRRTRTHLWRQGATNSHPRGRVGPWPRSRAARRGCSEPPAGTQCVPPSWTRSRAVLLPNHRAMPEQITKEGIGMYHENCSYLTILAEIRQAPYRNSARPVRRYSPCPTFKRAKQPPRPYFRSLLGPGTLVSFPAARSQATSSMAHISRPRISSSAAASSDLLFDGPREKAFLFPLPGRSCTGVPVLASAHVRSSHRGVS